MPDQTVTDAITAALAAGEDPSSPEERIKGFQRALARKDEELKALRDSQAEAAALRKRLEEMELAQMPEQERETFLTRREQGEMARLRQELELSKLALQYPDVAPHFNALFSASTAEEQALYLKGLLNGTSRASAAVVEDDFSGVDMNNPMRGPEDAISSPPGLVRDETTADRILKAFGAAPAAQAYRG